MGWSSGTELMENFALRLKKSRINAEIRKKVYLILVDEMEAMDWDNVNEVEGLDKALDEALVELHPEYYEDEDEEGDFD